MAALLETRRLMKCFAGSRVVDGLDLRADAGAVLGLLGPNGAGKTTTLRMLYGFIRPDGGEILYEGHPFERYRCEIKREIGVCTQEDSLDYDFTVRQNLSVYASYFRPKPQHLIARVDELLHEFDLDRFSDASPHMLSGGFKRRLLIARSVIHRPKMLFLDEPTTGLDPGARVALWETVDRMRRDGLGIVLTTHYMDEAERLSDSLVVLDRGKTLAAGATRQVIGALLGEHVVVVDRNTPGADTMIAWLQAETTASRAHVLTEVRAALTPAELATFSSKFAQYHFAVRTPTLDDLFLALSNHTRPSSRSTRSRT